MKTIFFYTFLLLLKTQLCSADSLVFLKTIPIEARLVSTDPVGNIYLVKENNTLLRLNDKGDSIGVFNEIKKGKISHIDASNPLRILLFFSDYNQLVVLNNMLTRKNVYQLNSIGLNNVSCIANSADGNIWLYEPVSGTLMKIDDVPSIRFTTTLKNIIEENIDPVFMVEQDRSLFMVDSIQGIKKFDQFGFYQSGFPFLTNEVQYINRYLVYYKHPLLYSYNTQTFNEATLKLPNQEDILQVRTERKNVYILRKESLDIYQLNENR